MANASNFDFEQQRKELVALIAQSAKTPGSYETAIKSLIFHRREVQTEPILCFYQPSLAFIAQGAKQVTLGNETYIYDQANYLLSSVDLPVASRVTLASPEKPYLSLSLRIDLRHVGELMAENIGVHSESIPNDRGISVSRISESLLDAILRLVRLLQTPRDIPILAPLIEREILYRLLMGEQGNRLRHLAITGSQSQQIASVIGWLRTNYARTLRVEVLAQEAGMSVSSLHHHFKAITAMSPLQFQKQLRLQEARRLMLTGMDAALAGHRVGYESPSHFSRDYSRLYGAPPVRDVAQLQRQNHVDEFALTTYELNSTMAEI